MTDGGEAIRSEKEIANSRREVRRYGADGSLYAYREGDEHVVVAKGWDRADNWTKRVPAKRTTVEPNESLWTIPDNWELLCHVDVVDIIRTGLYKIPETGAVVQVAEPKKDRIKSAQYRIQRVGELTITCDAELHPERISDELAEARPRLDPAVIDALQQLEQNWAEFEEQYRREVAHYGYEAFSRGLDDMSSGRIPGWSYDPWRDTFHVTDIVDRFYDVDAAVGTDVQAFLFDYGVLPLYPNIRVAVEPT